MVTVTYDFYKDIYIGDVSEHDFKKNITKARKLVSNRTNKCVDAVSDDDENEDLVLDIKMCICNVVDKLQTYSESGGKVVSSLSSGKVSESYVINGSNRSVESDIASVIKTWLSSYGFTNMMWI